MAFLTDRSGNISVFRVSIIIGAIGLVLLLAGGASFLFDQESRRAPFYVDLPPGAEAWGAPERRSEGWQFVYYKVPGAEIETIADFYNRKMREHYGTNSGGSSAETCKRFPPSGEFSDYNLEEGTIPYYYTCMFDNSGLNTTQWTQVTIQPGVPNEDAFRDSAGTIVIAYEQRWQP